MVGMGELHLAILLDRLHREFKVEARTGRPMVAYRETVRGSGRSEFTFDRELGGRKHFARIVMEVSSAPRSAGNSVEFDVSSNVIPAEFQKHIRDGINDVLVTGVIGNYPVTDLKVTVTDGTYDELTSSDMAFRSAAVMALRAAVKSADPVFLEPIMLVEVTVPTEYMGDVLTDMSSRKGRVKEIANKGPVQVISALVPLARLFGYASAVRSISKGRAAPTMEPQCFEIVSESIQQEFLAR